MAIDGTTKCLTTSYVINNVNSQISSKTSNNEKITQLKNANLSNNWINQEKTQSSFNWQKTTQTGTASTLNKVFFTRNNNTKNKLLTDFKTISQKLYDEKYPIKEKELQKYNTNLENFFDNVFLNGEKINQVFSQQKLSDFIDKNKDALKIDPLNSKTQSLFIVPKETMAGVDMRVIIDTHQDKIYIPVKDSSVKYPKVGFGSSKKVRLVYDVKARQFNTVVWTIAINKKEKNKENIISQAAQELEVHKAFDDCNDYISKNSPSFAIYKNKKGKVKIAGLAPYYSNRSLADFSGDRYSKSELETIEKRFWLYLFRGLEIMHERGYVHRDIKLENLYISADNELKIGDLGFAERIDKLKSIGNEVVGTLMYIAPEVYHYGWGNLEEPHLADDYSAGITMLCYYVKKSHDREIIDLWLDLDKQLTKNCEKEKSTVHLTRTVMLKDIVKRLLRKQVISETISDVIFGLLECCQSRYSKTTAINKLFEEESL